MGNLPIINNALGLFLIIKYGSHSGLKSDKKCKKVPGTGHYLYQRVISASSLSSIPTLDLLYS